MTWLQYSHKEGDKMQLLKITTTPIQLRYNIEQARLEGNMMGSPQHQVSHTPSSLKIDSSPVKVQISTERARESLGMRGPDSWSREYAGRGVQAAQEATGDAVRMGNEMQQIQDGVTIAQIIQNRMLQQHTPAPATQTFLPGAKPDISWEPPQVHTTYQPDKLSFNWQTQQAPMNYVPGKFSLEVLQHPKVSIEYLGGFNYVPPSADPDYQEPAE